MAKVKFCIYLEPDIFAALERHAAANRAAKSAVAEAAIAAVVTPDADELADVALIRRLDALVRVGERLERNLDISIELQALFVRYWLTLTPPLADAARTAAQAKGKERFEGFVGTLGRRLAQGGRFTREVSHDLRAPAPAPSAMPPAELPLEAEL
jgi:hypothetical protein